MSTPSSPKVSGADSAGSAAVMEFLDDSHRAIAAMLQRLQQVVVQMRDEGQTPALRSEAAIVHEWMGQHARQHHIDEEQHIFPGLLASTDPELVQTALRLTQDHGWIEQNWLELDPMLSAAAYGNGWFDPDVLVESVQLLVQLYDDHMLLEESVAYPAASPLIQHHEAARMRAEMEQRRTQRENTRKPA